MKVNTGLCLIHFVAHCCPKSGRLIRICVRHDPKSLPLSNISFRKSLKIWATMGNKVSESQCRSNLGLLPIYYFFGQHWATLVTLRKIIENKFFSINNRYYFYSIKQTLKKLTP